MTDSPFPSDRDRRQAEYLENRLSKNEKALRSWARRENTNAVRLYDRDIPEIPLCVEKFGDAPEAAMTMALYERPYEKDDAEEAAWLALMAESAARALGVRPDRVFTKTRRRMAGLSQYTRQASDSFETVVRERHLSFLVNLSDYLDTGLFLDHRPARHMVGNAARDLRVLNLFSYTGAFSVYAASGGARSVDSVDLSNTYLAWCERNFALNGLDGTVHRGIKADAMGFLARAWSAGESWDIIVADPPTFSNSTMAESDFDVNRDWPRLLRSCGEVLAPGGAIVFSSNSRRLSFDPSAIDLPCKDISDLSVPPDFRNRRIHRCWILGNANLFAAGR